jgi:hypothetical protein
MASLPRPPSIKLIPISSVAEKSSVSLLPVPAMMSYPPPPAIASTVAVPVNWCRRIVSSPSLPCTMSSPSPPSKRS